LSEEERKLVTILFADVIGSTQLGEKLDPERLRSLFSAYFSAMSAVIEAWGGTVEKFIGDAIMAAFGIPIVREDDAERALRASLEMLERLDDLNRDFRERHRVTLEIRIGVNTGEVIAPVGGPPDQMIVAGDAVNVAARLEQAAEPGTILVGERTYLTARNAFRFDEPAQLDLKGKAHAVPGYRLAGAREEGARGVPGLQTGMVGRDRELQALDSVLDQAVESGRPHLVTVFGPAGIGKSRLVTEFLRLVHSRHGGATVLRGRCLAMGQGITYWPLGEILRSACGIALDDPAPVAGEKLRRGAEGTLSQLGLEQAELERTIFALATTAGIFLPDNPLDALDPRSVEDELGRAWPLFAQAHAVDGPAVLLVEDLHFAVGDLVKMVERLVARATGPIVVVATARPEFAEAQARFAAGSEGSSSISLRPLSEEQSADLVEGLLAEADLPSGLRAEILAKAEGNPFFLEEIIRRLIDEGALVRESGTWRATPAASETPLPDTVHALLAARIDALPPKEKRVLQEASVVGRVFWEEPVAQSLGDGAVSDSLLELERKGLVFARPSSTIAGQVEFMFKHALVRDVAYASLPKARRARAHAELGGWIEELAGERTEEFVELVAHHYAVAVAGEDSDLAWSDDPASREEIRLKALRTLIAAGAAARKRFAVGKAVELHERALALVTTDQEERARVLEELGDDHSAALHGDDALEAYRGVLELPRGPAVRARLCLKVASIVAWYGAFSSFPEPNEVLALIKEGLDLAQDEETRARLLIYLADSEKMWRHYGQPDPVPVQHRIGFAREAEDIAERLRLPELSALVSEVLARVYWGAGQYDRYLEVMRGQLDFLDGIASLQNRAETLRTVSEATLETGGDFEEALRLAEESYALAKQVNAHQEMHASFTIMACQHLLGRWAAIFPVLERHLELFAQEPAVTCSMVRGGPLVGAIVLQYMGDKQRAEKLVNLVPPLPPEAVGRDETLLGQYALAAGDLEAALEAGTAILAEPSTWDHLYGAWLSVEALAPLKRWDRLREVLPRARELASGLCFLGPAADRAEGRMAAGTRDRSRGEALLRRALQGYEGLRMPFEAARTREGLAEVVEKDDRGELLRAALSAYRALGARPHVDRVSAAL
jgi:class 3 adenylate cyclase/tetratricopeptide (TPR) repeat protein